MFIYADESGNTGRHIFNEPRFYFQGALFSTTDLEPILSPVIDHYCSKLSISRIHAKKIPSHIVPEIACSLIDSIQDNNWEFHLTAIEKPYLAITKFVDSIFDSGENLGVRQFWYWHEFFRHTLCCLFDEVLTNRSKHNFWEAYLKDDYRGIQSVIRNALTYLDRYAKDRRLNEVARDGLNFAKRYPEQITLLANKDRKSYKGHTPNMVAFSNLIQDAHRFCKNHNVAPKAFYHDQQSEFGQTMREYHNLLSSIRISENKNGLMTSRNIEQVNYELGDFELVPSEKFVSLQTVDIFLWLTQRNEYSIKMMNVKERLSEYTEPFCISRASSEMIVWSWDERMSNTELSPEQIQIGNDLKEECENIHQERLREFMKKQVDKKAK